MPRRPRFEDNGAFHHVYARGVDGRRVFLADADRVAYLTCLGGVVREFGWLCFAYCLMDNHVHLLVQTREPNLGRGMQALHGAYAREFNERQQRVGHLFQTRFGSSRLWTPTDVARAFEYIAMNPVEAGMCSMSADWTWSSVGAAANDRPPAWLSRLDEALNGGYAVRPG